MSTNSSTSHDIISKLQSGDSIQVAFGNGKTVFRYYASFIGSLEPKYIIATMPESEGKILLLQDGKSVEIRCLIEGGLYTFSSSVQLSHMKPFPHFFLNYPDKIDNTDIRQAQRVTTPLSLEVQGANINTEDAPTTVQIVDISEGGASISATTDLGSPNDKISLKANFTLGGKERKITIPCTIRTSRTINDKSKNQHRRIIGVEFLLSDMTDDNKEFIYAYVGEKILNAKTNRLV